MVVRFESPPITAQSRNAPLRVAILGSTGSIGCSTLEVIRKYPQHFETFALLTGGNTELLCDQVQEFHPRFAGVASPSIGSSTKSIGSSTKSIGSGTEFVEGEDAFCSIVAHPECDIVLAAAVGVSGLRPVLAALDAGKRVALANKESLVAAGALVASAIDRSGGRIIPVDSEHSAIFQALQGHSIEAVHRLVLTASGGPFLNTAESDLSRITPEVAVQHPKWRMGAKISIDSATMTNKALEVIEAHWLFGMSSERIEVVVHPQSIIHSLVSFVDGVQLAQLAVPDMKGPIAYALFYPHGRLPDAVEQLDLCRIRTLEFFELDSCRFPAVNLAKQCIDFGGAMPAIFNIGNEVAVRRFLEGKLTFDRIVPFTAEAVEEFWGTRYLSLDELLDLDEWVRARLREK